MSASAQNDRVNNLTLEDIAGEVVDTFNKSSEIHKGVISQPTKWNGRDYRVPIFTNKSTLGQSFKGAETFSTAVDMVAPQMTFFATGYAQPVGVSLIEQAFSATPAGVISLNEASKDYAQNSLITNTAEIFYGYGLGNDFDGLRSIVDDGTNTSTYGGLSRSSYPTINGYLSTPAGGVLTLDALAASDDGSTISGDIAETSNRIMANQTSFSLYESLLTPTTKAEYQVLGGDFYKGSTGVKEPANMANGLNLKAGATSLDYRGKKLIRDQKCPSGSFFGINERWFQFRSLSIPALKGISVQQETTTGAYDTYTAPTALQFRDFMQPVNSLSEVGVFVMYGQFLCRNPNRNFLLYGVTTA